MQSPFISIITVSLDAEAHIEQTIQSVLSQTYKNIEYIIVDGASADRTVDIINRYREKINCFISETDQGIADAMNKGAARATGDYLLFLHADDYLKEPGSLQKAVEYLSDATDILACSIQFGKQLAQYTPRGFNFWTNFKQGIHHQGVLCKKSVFDGFDTRFKIAMDYDFFLRAYRKNRCLVIAPLVLSVMRDTGISSRKDWKTLAERFAEERQVHDKNCPSIFMKLLYKIYWMLYLPYRYLCFLITGKKGG